MPSDPAENTPPHPDGCDKDVREANDRGPLSLGRCEAFGPMMRFFLWGLRNVRRVEDLPAEKIENP